MECVKAVQATKSMSNESSGKINLGAEKQGHRGSKLKHSEKIDDLGPRMLILTSVAFKGDT